MINSDYAVIQDGIVTNTILWNGDTTQWQPPDGMIAVLIPDGVPVSIGYLYDGTNFSAPPVPPPTLAEAQQTQIALLSQSYAIAMSSPVSYTTVAGTTETFTPDQTVLQNVPNMVSAFTAAGTVPSGFFFLAADGTQVPFSLADLQGLVSAMAQQTWNDMQILQIRKNSVMAITDTSPAGVAAVQSITW